MKANKRTTFFLLVIMTYIATSCGLVGNSLGPEEYQEWVLDKSNGLHQEKVIGNCLFEIICKPCDYMIATELLRGNTKLDLESYQQDQLEYIDLKLEMTEGKKSVLRNNLSGDAEYYERLHYMNFTLQNDIYMVDGNDTIPCGFYHFENTYDAQSAAHVMLGFDKKGITGSLSNKQLIIYPRFLNVGIVKFNLTDYDNKNLPKLKI